MKDFLTNQIYKHHNTLLKKTIKLQQFCYNHINNKSFHFIIDTSFQFPQFIEPILKTLITSQQSLYSILTISERFFPTAIPDLSALITNLLTNNIFSIEAFSDDYLIILTRLIIDAVDNLQSKTDVDNFLKDNTALTAMLSSLYMRQDIIDYFKEILHFPLTFIDYIERDELFVFDVTKLERVFEIKKEVSTMQKSLDNSHVITSTNKETTWRPSFLRRANTNANTGECLNMNSSMIQHNNELSHKKEMELIIGKINLDKKAQEKIFLHICLKFPHINKEHISLLTETSFMEKYGPEIDVNTIETLILNEKDENMKEYLHNIKSKIKSEQSLYSNMNMINQMYASHSSKEIFELYRRFFCIVILLIEEIVLHLENNFGKIPDILRYICKVIELSLKIKFPDIKEYELIPFLGVFLFDKVMLPLFQRPHLFGLTDSMTLSAQTSKNIDMLYTIIKKFYRGDLFTSESECNYTFFNLFFITKMHILLHFFKKISTTTQLPVILDKFIHPTKYNFDPVMYKYDYFQLHPHSHLKEICCMYSITQVIKLYDILNEHADTVLGKDIDTHKKETLLKCISKLKHHYNELKSRCEQHEQSNIVGVRVFSVLEKSEMFINMEKFVEGNVHVSTVLNDVNVDNNDNDNNKAETIINAKKGFCTCLNYIAPLSGYQTELVLNCDDYKNMTLTDALETLASNIICKYNVFKWELEQLKPLFNNLPLCYAENNYELFMKEIHNEITKSLIDVNKYISIIGSYNDDIIYLKNELNRTNEVFTYFKKEMILQTVKRFVEHAHIRITYGLLNVNKKTDSYIFTVKRKRDNIVRSRMKICNTIQEFIKNFPNINERISPNENVFDYIKNTKLVDGLNTYFDIIKDEIKHNYDSMRLFECERFFQTDPLSPYCDVNTTSETITNLNLKEYKLSQLNDSFEIEHSNYTPNEEYTTSFNKHNNESIKDFTINQLSDRVTDYIYTNIYNNIFPIKRTKDDIAFETQCDLLSTKTLTEFEPAAVVNCTDCIVESVECVHRFENACSPYEKGFQLNKILSLIKGKLQYIHKGEVAPDDFLPYVWYSIIKAKPKKYKTNVEFLSLFKVKPFAYAITTIKTIENRINLNKEDNSDSQE